MPPDMTQPESDAVDASSERSVPEERFVTLDGRRLRLLDWGTPGRPPGVLLREMAVGAGRWDRSARAWRDALHVVAPRVYSGGGDPPRTDVANPGTAAYSADVLRVADALGWGRFSVVGESTSGTLGIYLAAEYPERIERLVISDAEPLDLWLRLQDIRCPTLLVRGAGSTILRQEIAERMIQEIADCRLVVVPDGGHSTTADPRGAHKAAIRDFLLGKEPVGAFRAEHDIG